MISTTTRGRSTVLALTLLVGGLASSCGAEDSPSPSTSASSAPSTSAAQAPSPSTSTAPSSSRDAAASVVITIKDFKYDVPTGIQPGTEITVKNEDDVAHTVTARDGKSFDVKVAGGGTATFTAPERGSFDFYCVYHSNMEATLEVG